MKMKKITAALLAGVLAATMVVSVSAATLTYPNTDGSTKVTATIEGITPGEVSYVITIPEEVSFGNLTQPENSIDDSYKYCNFQVEATELNNFEKNDAVSVYLKDGSESNDVYFYLAQEGGSYRFVYDVYDCAVNDDNIADNTPINEDSVPGEYGYNLCTFNSDAQGTSQEVTLAFNQKYLCGTDINDLAGNYSGSLVFHSSLIEILG